MRVDNGAALELSNSVLNIAVGSKALQLGLSFSAVLRSQFGDNSWAGDITVGLAEINVPSGSLSLPGRILSDGILFKTGSGELKLTGSAQDLSRFEFYEGTTRVDVHWSSEPASGLIRKKRSLAMVSSAWLKSRRTPPSGRMAT